MCRTPPFASSASCSEHSESGLTSTTSRAGYTSAQRRRTGSDKRLKALSRTACNTCCPPTLRRALQIYRLPSAFRAVRPPTPRHSCGIRGVPLQRNERVRACLLPVPTDIPHSLQNPNMRSATSGHFKCTDSSFSRFCLSLRLYEMPLAL